VTTSLTPTAVVAEAERVLGDAGYRINRNPSLVNLPEPHSLLAEDAFGVVLLVVFRLWVDLANRWSDAQDSLVTAMSARLTRSNPKAWEGYLVLMCPEESSAADEELQNNIRSDVRHVRKIVAGGGDLRALDDVARVLLPLTPITLSGSTNLDRDILLERLPQLLAERNIDAELVRQVVTAFRAGEPLMEALDRALNR